MHPSLEPSFVHFCSHDNERILRPIELLDQSSPTWISRLVEDERAPYHEGEVIVYYQRRREFLKQVARLRSTDEWIAAHTQADEAAINPEQLLALELVGEPMSAESRGCYRTSTLFASLEIDFDSQDRRQLLDISATGFAVQSGKERQIGDVVDVALTTSRGRFRGASSVQSVKPLNNDQWRLGVNCIDQDPRNRLLQELTTLSMQVQRDQLRRLSGAA